MQFRQKTHRDKDGNVRPGQTIQLMRYTYDAENRRGRQVMVGSFKMDAPRLPTEVETLLTPQEKAEFEEWKKTRWQSVATDKLAVALDALDGVMTRSCMALDVGAGTVKDPARIWALIDALERSMSRAGHERPARPRGRPVYEVVYDEDDFAALDALPNFIPPEKKVPKGKR